MMKTYNFISIFIALSLFGCTKPNPNPELADEIYLDLQSRAQSVEKEVETEKKKFEGFKKEMETAVPQTGAIKFAQKRYFESEIKIGKLGQLANYYGLKAESRKQYTKAQYARAFKDRKPWPTEEELASYKQYQESAKAEKSWNSQARVKEYEKKTGAASTAAKIAEKTDKKAEAGSKTK
jgi:hypothetical protein